MVDPSVRTADPVLPWVARHHRPTAEELLMGEDAQVVLARLEGRVEALTEVVEVRLRTQERDVESHRLSADNEHRKLQADIREVTEALREMQEFRSKLYGIGVGLTLASGTISGLLVALLTNLNGA